MNYLELLEYSYKNQQQEQPCDTRASWLSEYIFNFATYDDDIAESFGKRALEVCDAIHKRTTFDYIKNIENYTWFVAICNMPFFVNRIEWGTSIRGAFWKYDQPHLDSPGLHSPGVAAQFCRLQFNSSDDWVEFIDAVLAFGRSDEP